MLTTLLTMILAAGLPANTTYGAAPAASTVRYTVVHPLHRVDARSDEVQAKAVVREDGTVVAQVRIPISAFRSGDGNRDLHMLETMEAGRFPSVEFKGIARLGPGRELPSGPLQVDGELDLHGVRRGITLTLQLTPQPDGALRVQGAFDVSLDAHRIERPALLFVRVEDRCHVDLDLALRPERRG